MVRALVVALAVAGFAPAADAQPRTGFAFGRIGGNILPYAVTITATGAISARGPVTLGRKQLTQTELDGLRRSATANAFARLPAVTACPGTLPDVAATFIRVGARTVRVHGHCLARYERVWTALTRAAEVSP
jgi:hypothetical protein